jgi:hypothetical protein
MGLWFKESDLMAIGMMLEFAFTALEGNSELIVSAVAG